MSLKFYECESCKSIFSLVSQQEKLKNCSKLDLKEVKPDSVDAAKEKHVPFVKIEGDKVIVRIGETEHPMIDEHYIEWIILETKCGAQIRHLHPGEKPEAVFILTEEDKAVAAYEYCNIHGLWKKGL